MALTTMPPFGNGAGGNRHGPLGGDGVGRRSAQHHLALGSRDANALGAGAGPDILLQIAGIDRDLDIEDADLLHRRIEQDDVGGAGLLALDVDQVIAQRLHVDDVRRARHDRGKRRIDPEGARLVEGHLDPLDVAHLADEDAAAEEPRRSAATAGSAKCNKASTAAKS